VEPKQFHRILSFGSINLRSSGTRWTGRPGPDRAYTSTSASLARRAGCYTRPGPRVLTQQTLHKMPRLSLTPQGGPRQTFQHARSSSATFMRLRVRRLRQAVHNRGSQIPELRGHREAVREHVRRLESRLCAESWLCVGGDVVMPMPFWSFRNPSTLKEISPKNLLCSSIRFGVFCETGYALHQALRTR